MQPIQRSRGVSPLPVHIPQPVHNITCSEVDGVASRHLGPIIRYHDVILETVNTSPPQEDRVTSTGNMQRKFNKVRNVRRVVLEICVQTDRQTERYAHHSNPLRRT